jgi:hypothetical protein
MHASCRARRLHSISDLGSLAVVTQKKNRFDNRGSVFLLGRLRLQSGEQKVKVRNLSSGGAMLEQVSGLAVGDRAWLFLNGPGWVEGIIAWVMGSRAGLAFSHPIDPDAAKMRVAAPAAKQKAPVRSVS